MGRGPARHNGRQEDGVKVKLTLRYDRHAVLMLIRDMTVSDRARLGESLVTRVCTHQNSRRSGAITGNSIFQSALQSRNHEDLPDGADRRHRGAGSRLST